MHSFIKSIAFAAVAAFTTSSFAAKLTPVWEIDGLKMPESVVFDAERNQYYVSNINGGPLSEDHNGSVSLISGNGKNVIVDWVEGLSSPKGMDLHGNKLYVADVKELVVIDVEKQVITARYPLPKAIVLNGLDVAEDGTLFVGDWLGNKVYTLEDNGLELWYENSKLNNPNGLFVANGYVYIGSWGQNPGADFTTETSGTFLRVSIKTKKLEVLNEGKPWMNLDGIHETKSGDFLITDFIKGELLTMSKKGKLKKTFDLEPSAADFFYAEEKGLIVVPYLMGQKVVAYQYK